MNIAALAATHAASNGVTLPGADLKIPDALDRTKGMSRAEIDASRDRAVKNAERGRKAGSKEGAVRALREKGPPSTGKNLTEADKRNIAALKNGGGDKKAEKARKAEAAKAKKAEAKAAKAKAKAEAKAKKAAAPKKAASAGPKVGTIGAVANAALMAGKTNDEALAAVKKAFPKCKSNLACMSWYRGKLRELGKLPAAAAPAKAKAATKRSARPTRAGR